MIRLSEIFPAAPLRAPDFEDDFSGGSLRKDLWIDHYLPHWTTPERSAAHYELVADGGVRLLIVEDQLDWREEDAPLRVSNLQTAVFSGPVGSEVGTHRHRAGLTVRTETPERILWAPTGGRIDLTVSASVDEGCMLAAWGMGGTVIGCNGVVVKRSRWAPTYPMVLLIDLFETGGRSTTAGAYPKPAVISSVRGWQS